MFRSPAASRLRKLQRDEDACERNADNSNPCTCQCVLAREYQQYAGERTRIVLTVHSDIFWRFLEQVLVLVPVCDTLVSEEFLLSGRRKVDS